MKMLIPIIFFFNGNIPMKIWYHSEPSRFPPDEAALGPAAGFGATSRPRRQCNADLPAGARGEGKWQEVAWRSGVLAGCVWKCRENPEKTNGFADHYPYEMAISLGILTQHFQTNPAVVWRWLVFE